MLDGCVVTAARAAGWRWLPSSHPGVDVLHDKLTVWAALRNGQAELNAGVPRSRSEGDDGGVTAVPVEQGNWLVGQLRPNPQQGL